MRPRLGLLALANDPIIAADIGRMLPDDAALSVSRIPYDGKCAVTDLGALEGRLTSAAQRAAPDGGLAAVMFGCVSGSAVIGAARIRDAVQKAQPRAVCITPMTAAGEALRFLGASVISVLTPYTDEVAAAVAARLCAAGFAVNKTVNFNLAEPDEISALRPAAIRAKAAGADAPDSEALFICCTAIRAAEVAAAIEDDLGKPVVTGNQALVWGALSAVGETRPISGYGRLLRFGKAALAMAQSGQGG